MCIFVYIFIYLLIEGFKMIIYYVYNVIINVDNVFLMPRIVPILDDC